MTASKCVPSYQLFLNSDCSRCSIFSRYASLHVSVWQNSDSNFSSVTYFCQQKKMVGSFPVQGHIRLQCGYKYLFFKEVKGKYFKIFDFGLNYTYKMSFMTV